MTAAENLKMLRGSPAWKSIHATLDAVASDGIKSNPDVERAILELLPVGAKSYEYEILTCLMADRAATSEAEICKAVCIARLDGLIEYGGGFGDLKITGKGVARLQELIYQDRTRAARLVADTALGSIVAEMNH